MVDHVQLYFVNNLSGAVCFDACLIYSGNSPIVVAKILQDDLYDLSKWIVMSKINFTS